MERRLEQNSDLREEYERIIESEIESGIMKAPNPLREREAGATTKVRMVFDADAKPHYLASSINDCMHKGSPCNHSYGKYFYEQGCHQPLGDIEKALLQIDIKDEDRNAFRFQFTLEDEKNTSDSLKCRLELKPVHSSWVRPSIITMVDTKRSSKKQ